MNKYFKIFSVLSSLVLFIGVFVVVRELRKGREIKFPVAATYPGKLTFSPTTISVRPGQNFDQTISVNMNTGGKAVAHADVQILFNRGKLELTGITKESHTVFKTYAPVNSSGNFDSAKVISKANTNGLVSLSILSFDWAAGTKKNPFNGTFNALTKLSFKAKSGVTGTATISFKYLSGGDTTDSNLVHKPSGSDPEDVLANPTSSVTVSFISPTKPPTSTPTSRPTNTPTSKPTSTPTPTVTNKPTNTTTPTDTIVQGDANNDGVVDIADYVIWVEQYGNYNPTLNEDPDFNGDQKVDGEDYIIWFNDFGN